MKAPEIDFDIRKCYFYYGPSHYLSKQALVFNLHIVQEGPEAAFYMPWVFEVFPRLKSFNLQTVADLFAHTLLEVLRMDVDLYINDFNISEDADDYVIAIEFLDDYTAEDAVILVSDWFKSMNTGTADTFRFREKFESLQKLFNKSLLGGPTLYSLVEAGLKNDIPVFFLSEENQYQWGYGIKQLRGRSTTFHTDGIKDTEFTVYKDMVAEFLQLCGFPTPEGNNCLTEYEALSEAGKLGFPLVIKPVSGHKGQGVITGIQSEAELKIAFRQVLEMAQKEESWFDGAIVQKHISGHDHRLLTIDGKFAAALKRIPAYVDGTGEHSIEQLIAMENEKAIRRDNARSPLSRIETDNDLLQYLKLQELSLQSVPQRAERIFLRRVANISAGGVSVNVTDEVHPKNIQLAESMASFFNIKCLGIDVLTEDISRPWSEGNFGIIEINAGPGVFMHLAPAYGGSLDIPEKIILSHFGQPELSRIPIIAGNNISPDLVNKLQQEIQNIEPGLFMGALTPDGVFFDGGYFYKNPSHEQNVKIILRNPRVGFAVFCHRRENIYSHGFFHQGADIVILDHPNWAEETLKEQLLPAGFLIEISDAEIKVSLNSQTLATVEYNEENKDQKILQQILPHLPEIISRYYPE